MHGHAAEAKDLASLVQEWKENNAPADPIGVCEIVRQIAELLIPLHRQKPAVVYGNLRPENVRIVHAADGSLQCHLVDLGAPPHHAESKELFDPYAEPFWLPPHPPQPSDDVFALGVLWFQLLTRDLKRGRPAGPSWRRKLLKEGMPAALLDLLETCWDDDPAERPDDAQVLAQALGEHLQPSRTAATPVVPPAPVEAPPPRPRGRRANLEHLFDSLERAAPERLKRIANSIGMKLVLIPEGTFLMGSPPEEPGRKANEGPLHEVQLTKAFYLGVHPVTQEQYHKVMGVNPSRFSLSNGGGLDHPVENVSWEDAVAFCRRLSELSDEKQASRRYRLPTEAEWEYACRAGTTGPFSFGPALAPGQANFDTAYPFGADQTAPPLQKTSPVDAFPPNHFGLHDMHGNVWEWCADWLDGAYYRVSPRRDPQGPPAGQFRVIRGGCWRNHALTCRSAYRNGLSPTARDPQTGFRILLDLT